MPMRVLRLELLAMHSAQIVLAVAVSVLTPPIPIARRISGRTWWNWRPWWC